MGIASNSSKLGCVNLPDLARTATRAACKIAAALVAVCCLGGCMVGPDYARPKVDVQQQWRDSGDSRLSSKAINCYWWKGFNDPVLDELILQAYNQNLPLHIAGLRIIEARAQLGVAVGLQYPQKQEFFTDVRGVGLSRNAPNSSFVDRSFYDYTLGFDAAWELDFWGRFRRNVQAAEATVCATAADYDNAIVSLTAEVARTYTDIRTFEVLIQLAEQNIAVQEDGLKMAESRFRHGATTELDVTQARTLLESTRSTVPGLQASLRQSQNALSVLLGQPPGPIDILQRGPKGIPTTPVAVAVGMPADLLRRRPDVRSAELQAAAQASRIGVAEADLYPAFSLVGNIGFETSSGGGLLSNRASCTNLFDARSLIYSWGPSVRWPIFNYGQLTNNVRAQDARFQQLLVNYQNSVLTAAQEVEDAETSFLNAQEAAASSQKAVEAARRSVDLSTSQYKEGAVDYERVLDSQRALLQEENRLAQIQSSIATSWVALYKALGGGWELGWGKPVVPLDMQEQMRKRTDWGDLLPAKVQQQCGPEKCPPVLPCPDF